MDVFSGEVTCSSLNHPWGRGWDVLTCQTGHMSPFGPKTGCGKRACSKIRRKHPTYTLTLTLGTEAWLLFECLHQPPGSPIHSSCNCGFNLLIYWMAHLIRPWENGRALNNLAHNRCSVNINATLLGSTCCTHLPRECVTTSEAIELQHVFL